MRKIINFAVNNPITILMAVLGIMLLGKISYDKLSVDLLPDLNNPKLYVDITAGERPPEEIEKLFGATVAELVEGVTKLTRANFSTSEQAQMENLRKMFMAMSKDIRVVLIKIADRLHNMRTMQYQTPAKQIIKCRETMDIYAPLAHRLGMQRMKWEMEDRSLKFLDPIGYKEIDEELEEEEEPVFVKKEAEVIFVCEASE